MARTKGTWGTVREVPRKGSGRYQASYVHGGVWGVQRGVRFTAPQTFETKGDAWAWIDRERRLIERDEWTPPYERILAQQDERVRIEAARQAAEAIPTIASYGAEYVKRDDLSGGTRQRYAQLLKFYIVGDPATITRRGMVKGQPVVHHGIGDIRITELTRSHVRTWWRGLPVKTRESSSRQSYDLLRAILNAAVEEELIDVNPVRIKDAASARASRERDQDPLPFDILYRVADAMPAPWRLGVLIGGVLGLRSGEVRALQRRDFTLTGEVPLLKVHQAVKEDEGKLEIGPLKTARKGVASRTLVIPAALLPDIKAHLRDHTQLGRTGLLFWRTSDGRPARASQWLKAFKKACNQVAADLEAEAAKVTAATGEPESDDSQRLRETLTAGGGYVFHGTRSTGLTMTYRASGGNLKVVEETGGYTSPKMAMRYQRAELRFLVTVAENLSDMIEQAKTKA